MPKSRIMSAGTVGTNKRVRVNGPEGGGNKLQGLPPICNMRSPLVPFVRTRADGENRNVVFCVNQLGGVGAKRGQFGPGNRAGVGQTGGCATGLIPHTALLLLKSYFNTSEGSVILVGKKETLTSDNVDHPERFESIKHYYPGTNEYETLPSNIKQAVDHINAMQIKAPLKQGEEPVPHVVGYATVDAQTALLPNYGKIKKLGPENNILMYGSNCLGDCLGALGLSTPAIVCICASVAAAPETGTISLGFIFFCIGGAAVSTTAIIGCVNSCMSSDD